MVNFIIQYNIDSYDFSADNIHSLLNHFNYKHFYYKNKNIKIDYLQHKQDNEKRFFSNDELVVFYLGNILFKDDKYNTVEQLKKLYLNNKNIVDEILSGRFVVVIYDKKHDKILIINDRFGLIPYFIYKDNKNFIVCTEPKGIIYSRLLKDKKFDLDYAAVANYFKYSYILGDKYIFKEIRKQKPAILMAFQNNNYFEKCYWNFKIHGLFNKRIDDKLLDGLLASFREGLKKNKKKYPGNYVCDISGGYDCRFIFLNSPDIKYVMTMGDTDCNEYGVVVETLKVKPAELINVKAQLTKEKLYKLLDLTDLSTNLGRPVVFDIFDEFSKFKSFFQYEYDGFLGDAILGGSYMNPSKEIFRQCGLNLKYGLNDFDITSCNIKILNKNFLKKLEEEDDYWKVIDKNKIVNMDNNDMIRKNLIVFKTMNRGLNYINANGSLLKYKYLNIFFPFFYYPFFDLYAQIHPNDLGMKKTYTLLYQKLPLCFQGLKDHYFLCSFSFPYKFRVLFKLISGLIPDIFKNTKKRDNFPDDLIHDKNLFLWFKEVLTNDSYSWLLNIAYLRKMFEDNTLVKKNYDYLNRTLGFILFLEKFDNKINKTTVINNKI